jgi:hypothetical protein
VIEILLIAGRSGVGKTTVSYEVSECLREHDIPHALVDGDNLDAVYPPVEGSALAERNLAAVWRSYRQLGHDRLIYVNTVSVLEDAMVRRAIGEEASVTGVLLQATDAVARERLTRREIGTTLDVHLERSANASTHLETTAPAWVHRVPTDGRTVRHIARSILRLTGWLAGSST